MTWPHSIRSATAMGRAFSPLSIRGLGPGALPQAGMEARRWRSWTRPPRAHRPRGQNGDSYDSRGWSARGITVLDPPLTTGLRRVTLLGTSVDRDTPCGGPKARIHPSLGQRPRSVPPRIPQGQRPVPCRQRHRHGKRRHPTWLPRRSAQPENRLAGRGIPEQTRGGCARSSVGQSSCLLRIKALLQGRDAEEQARILRWVAESLSLPPATSHQRQPPHHLPPAPTSPSTQAGPPSPAPTLPTASTDIRTFTEQKAPKSEVQFVAVAAYFYRFLASSESRKEAINSDDLQQAARLAGRPVFTTPSNTFNNAVKQGYMDRADRGEYRLNAVGENLVSMTLPSSDPGRPPKQKRSSKKKPSAKRKTAKTMKS
jgi:hypothetical protein